MVVQRFIVKNNQNRLSRCFIFIPKTDVGLPRTGVRFYCVGVNVEKYLNARSIFDKSSLSFALAL